MRLFNWWPFVTRARLVAAGVAHTQAKRNERDRHTTELLALRSKLEGESVASLARERVRHARELDETKKAVGELVEHFSRTEWRRSFGQCYRITLTFDPMILSGHFGERTLDMLAEEFGRRVQREIRTSKFVEKAHEAEERDRIAWPGFRP